MTQPIDWDGFDPVTRAAHGLFREFATAKGSNEDWTVVVGLEEPKAELGFVHADGTLGAVYRLVTTDTVQAPKDLRDVVEKLERDAGPSPRTGVIVVVKHPRSRQWRRAVRVLNQPYTRVAQIGERVVVDSP